MTDRMTPRAPAQLLRGILLLARFRSEGFGLLGHTPAAFVNSLAPALAFPLVRGAMLLVSGDLTNAVRELLSSLVVALAPAVLSHFLATAWKREAFWLSYIIGFNWCLSGLSLLLLLIVGVAPQLVSSGDLANPPPLLGAIAVYWIALSWFLAWRGLRISGGRAVLLLLLLNAATIVLVLGPSLLMMGS